VYNIDGVQVPVVASHHMIDDPAVESVMVVACGIV
jgi:hypothetical protein